MLTDLFHKARIKLFYWNRDPLCPGAVKVHKCLQLLIGVWLLFTDTDCKDGIVGIAVVVGVIVFQVVMEYNCSTFIRCTSLNFSL
jgi:hypothetical protein